MHTRTYHHSSYFTLVHLSRSETNFGCNINHQSVLPTYPQNPGYAIHITAIAPYF